MKLPYKTIKYGPSKVDIIRDTMRKIYAADFRHHGQTYHKESVSYTRLLDEINRIMIPGYAAPLEE